MRWSVAFDGACSSCMRFLFSCNVMKSTLENIFYGCKHYYDNLFVLNSNHSTYDYHVNYASWYAKLGHIWQDRVNRLAKEGY